MDPGVPHILLNSIILQVAVAPMHLHSLVADLMGNMEETDVIGLRETTEHLASLPSPNLSLAACYNEGEKEQSLERSSRF